MKTYIILIALTLTACSPKYKHWGGTCLHPAVNGGMPFELSDKAFFDGVSIGMYSEDGKLESRLTGATCVINKPIKK